MTYRYGVQIVSQYNVLHCKVVVLRTVCCVQHHDGVKARSRGRNASYTMDIILRYAISKFDIYSDIMLKALLSYVLSTMLRKRSTSVFNICA